MTFHVGAAELARTRWRSPAAVDVRVNALARLIAERMANLPPLRLAHLDTLTKALTENVVLDDSVHESGAITIIINTTGERG